MSKLYSIYSNLKKEEPDVIFLFKSGIFYIALDKDALYLSNLLHFKLTDLNENIKKIGFPCKSMNKYEKLFRACHLNYKIINTNTNTSYSALEYYQKENFEDIIELIKGININNLSVSEAYEFIETLKRKIEESN